MIQTKVTNLPEKGDAKFLITEDTVEKYISPAVRENPNWRKMKYGFTMMTMTNPYLLNTVQKKPEDLVANTVTPYRNII